MQADPQQVIRLLKTARGQLDGILKMVEEDRYCIDISNQVLATQALLKRVHREILSAHMQCCVRHALETGDTDEKLQEITSLLEKLL